MKNRFILIILTISLISPTTKLKSDWIDNVANLTFFAGFGTTLYFLMQRIKIETNLQEDLEKKYKWESEATIKVYNELKNTKELNNERLIKSVSFTLFTYLLKKLFNEIE